MNQDERDTKFFVRVAGWLLFCVILFLTLIIIVTNRSSVTHDTDNIWVQDEEAVVQTYEGGDTSYLYIIKVSKKVYDLIDPSYRTMMLHQTMANADVLGTEASDILTAYYLESRLNPFAAHTNKNGDTTAYGLLQWTPTAAEDLGVSWGAIKRMGVYEQLQLTPVWLNHISRGKSFSSFSDLYLTNYLPAYRWKPDHFEIDSQYVASNPIGRTIGEVRQHARRMYGKINNT